MPSCRHLIVDGGAYLQVLPRVVTDWTEQANWQTIVNVLREQNEENDGVMPTMLDDSNVEDLTFYDPEVPTLAILAAMSQGKQIKRIHLRGWDSDEANMPQDWKDFLAAEKAERSQAAAGTGEVAGFWPIFGAAAPQVAMLPLVVILMATAIKDGVEDYRRSELDDEVNNSAATKLGEWRNVNQPRDPRTWWEKMLGTGAAPDRVTKGVRKLREKEAAEGKNIVLVKNDSESVTAPSGQDSAGSISESTLNGGLARRGSLDDIQSVGSHSLSLDHTHNYPPIPGDPLGTSAATLQANVKDAIEQSGQYGKGMGYSTTSFKSSIKSSGGTIGVVDWSRQVTGTARWERTLWKKLEVGDIVLLRDNDQIPADIVVLSTSDADGLCYVETKNLDGETNLKPRRSLKATATITSEEDIEHSAFILDSEPPHANLYNYNGVLRYRGRSTGGDLGQGDEKQEPVTINELLLRGCT
ncbi:hypothetical protein FRB90_006699, partial [Tulasnella sp. 427]